MRNTNIVASFLLLMRGDKILLHKRCNSGYHDGEYSLIAGHVEAGETFTSTIIREAKEEAGITLKPGNLTVVHVMHHKSDVDASERVNVYFLARKWEGEITNGEPEKCEELEWFDVHNLPPNIIDAVRKVINNVLKKIPYSEYGW